MNLISSNLFPIKTTLKKLAGNKSEFSIYPLNPGFGQTIGNSLRRVLISSIPGYAVTKIKINNFTHEYQGVEGIVEDLQQVILNIKGLHVKVETNEDIVTLILKSSKKGEITAANFSKQSGVEIMNPGLFICTIEKDFDLELLVEVKKGYGFYQVDDAVLSASQSLSDLYVDALYSPIQNVAMEVEKVRVGDNTNLDKVVLTFETNGTVDEKLTVQYALELMVDQYSKISSAFQSVDEITTDTNLPNEVTDEVVSVSEPVESLGLTKATTAHLLKNDLISTADLIKEKDAINLFIKSLKSKADKDILLACLGEKKVVKKVK
jgi:DNA-directed RNA polymerase subunit alpha